MRDGGFFRFVAAAIFGLLLSAAAHAGDTVDRNNQGKGNWGTVGWAASWATANKVQSLFDAPTPAFNDVTLRQVVRISRGGSQARVWFDNSFGTQPLTIADAHIALRAAGPAIQPHSNRALTFNGSTQVQIAPGAKVVSDPVRLRLPALADVVISAHLPQDLSAQASPATYHVRALQTSYIAPGNQAAAEDLAGADTTTAWYYLSALDVQVKQPGRVVAAFGDSITDGDQQAAAEPVDENARYTNFLAELLQRSKRDAVINLGISGNQVTADFIGLNMQARLDRDVLAQTGVTHVIVLGGINDIGLPILLGAPSGADADTLIAAHQQIAARAKARGLKVIGGTLTPSGSVLLPGYNSAETQIVRRQVNDWIRQSGAYDAVADFDRALRDPDNPDVLLEAYSADGLHPNSDGYRRMAQVAAAALKRADSSRSHGKASYER